VKECVVTKEEDAMVRPYAVVVPYLIVEFAASLVFQEINAVVIDVEEAIADKTGGVTSDAVTKTPSLDVATFEEPSVDTTLK
jgi:hypothetical protein